MLTILPIKICNDAGNNCANNGEKLYLAESNKIWAQAGITLTYLAFTTINSSKYLTLDNATEVADLFSDAPGASNQAKVITMWFTDNHFDAWGEVNAISGNKVVIDDGIFDNGRRDTIAHEIGHLLGLKHDDPGVETDFLMRSSDRLIPNGLGNIVPDGTKLDKLTAAQIATAMADGKVMAVPEPASWALLIAGFAMVGHAMRRRPSAHLALRPAAC